MDEVVEWRSSCEAGRRGAGEGLPTGYLRVAEVAELLGVAPSFVYRRTSAGHPDPIPCYRFGGHLRFLGTEVQEWAAGHRKDQEWTERRTAAVVGLDKSRGRVRLRVRERRS